MENESETPDEVFQHGPDPSVQIDLSFDIIVTTASTVCSALLSSFLSSGERMLNASEHYRSDDLMRYTQFPRSPDTLNTPVSGDTNFNFTRPDFDPLPITGITRT